MFEFKADIVKRRKVSFRAVLLALAAAGLLIYALISFVQTGIVRFIEMIIDQIGLNGYAGYTYVAIFAILFFLILPGIRSIFKKKTIVGGTIAFDEDNLEIKKGREHFVIPEKEIAQLNFELKKLPENTNGSEEKLFGGSYMRIPTTKGVFECELDIKSKEDQVKLLNMIEFLKIEHDVKIEVKEVK